MIDQRTYKHVNVSFTSTISDPTRKIHINESHSASNYKCSGEKKNAKEIAFNLNPIKILID